MDLVVTVDHDAVVVAVVALVGDGGGAVDSVSAGDGLTQNTITGDIILNVGEGQGITVQSNEIEANIDTTKGLKFEGDAIAVNLGAGLTFNGGAIDVQAGQALQYKGTVDLEADASVPANPIVNVPIVSPLAYFCVIVKLVSADVLINLTKEALSTVLAAVGTVISEFFILRISAILFLFF